MVPVLGPMAVPFIFHLGRFFFTMQWPVGIRKRKQKFKVGGDKGGTPITILASSAIISCAGYV